MSLRAGASVVDISPAGPVALFGYPHVERIATGVHDPLLASALCLDDGRQRAMLIALDLLMLDPPRARSIRRAVAERTGVPERCVLMSCSHTHSGPVTARLVAWSGDAAVPAPDAAYLDMLADRVVAAAEQAAANVGPAEIAWTTADARGVGGNRLSSEGATDPEVGILGVREPDGGRLRAVVVMYGMHPTVLHEDSTLVSADFPHYAREVLRERFGVTLPVLYHTGPCGDQSPRRFVAGQTFEEAERLGRTLGESVARSLERLDRSRFSSDCRLGGVVGEIALPRRRFLEVAEAERLLDHHRAEFRRLKEAGAEAAKVRGAECAVFGAEGTVQLAHLQERGDLQRALEEDAPVEVQVVQVGEVSLIGLPGEWFVEYGLELKRRWPNRAFVVSLVNGHVQGYVATAEAVAEESYEALTAVFDGPEAGRRMIETVMGMADGVR